MNTRIQKYQVKFFIQRLLLFWYLLNLQNGWLIFGHTAFKFVQKSVWLFSISRVHLVFKLLIILFPYSKLMKNAYIPSSLSYLTSDTMYVTYKHVLVRFPYSTYIVFLAFGQVVEWYFFFNYSLLHMYSLSQI